MGVWQWVLEHWALVWTYLYVGVDVLLRLISLVVVPRNRRPGSALAWLLAIMVLPIVGFPLFLLLGRSQLPRRRLAKQRVVNRLMRVRAHSIPDSELDEDVPSWLQGAVQLNRELGAFPLTGNNSAELEIDYDTSIARMAEDIRSARESVHVLFYIRVWTRPPRTSSTRSRSGRGRGDGPGPVRPLGRGQPWRAVPGPRGAGSMRTASSSADDADPADPRQRLPAPDLRNHRKMVIVDGEIGGWDRRTSSRPLDKPANIRRGLHWRRRWVGSGADRRGANCCRHRLVLRPREPTSNRAPP